MANQVTMMLAACLCALAVHYAGSARIKPAMEVTAATALLDEGLEQHSNITADGACPLAVTISGLGVALDGDYRADAGAFYQHYQDNGRLLTRSLSRFDTLKQTEWFNLQDPEAVLGKWIIFEGKSPVGQTCGASPNPPCAVHAVCESGCPDLPTHNVQGWPTGNWPQTGSYTMQWQILKGQQEATASATGSCCKRKAQPCDSCGMTTCANLDGSCKGKGNWWSEPPKPTDLQQKCCESNPNPKGPGLYCSCVGRVDVCDHR